MLGSMTRFANHFCEAKCRFCEMRNIDKVIVLFVAIRPIQPIEEITVRYNFDEWSPRFDCKCLALNCVGRSSRNKIIGGAKAAKTDK